ncbi:hypothetical protein GF323_06350 [Candidatus Woesearchaeota archaeon]|nr:hypothetical protein [Candidatus Woesearchaeota archaeon]
MEHLKKHKEEFERIIRKYNLKEKEKAAEIADFLTKSHGKKISAKEFAKLFGMSEQEAVIFLSWIQKGIKFKEENMNRG